MISVVIPLYNRADLILHSLNSLAPENHSGLVLEVIVVDDASQDNGPEVVRKKFPGVTVVENTSNKGASACRNQGISLALGEFIFFLDSDDIVEKDFFAERIKRLQSDTQLMGVYGPWTHFESEAEYQETLIRPRKASYPLYEKAQSRTIIENILAGWYIPINATVWRTQAVREAGGFDEQLRINQDVDFCFRMLLQGEVCGIPSPRALIRIHQGERVGHTTSEDRLKQMLELRKGFMRKLEQQQLAKASHRQALGTFAFNLWAAHRKEYPEVSSQLLILSHELYPELTLKGTRWLRLLASVIGNVNAIKFKQWLQ